SSAQSPLAGIVRVIPIERLNALLVVTTQPKYLEMAKTWIDRIDQAGTTSGGTRFYVYRVKNGKAESLAQLISDLFSSHRTTSNEVRVIADKDTNSLLILATPADYDTIENALRQLDVVPRQVLVEVMLAEVTLSDNLSLGLNYFLHTRNSTTGYLQTGNLGTAGGDANSGIAGIPSPSSPVPGINGGLQLINFVGTDVRAVLNALGSDGKAKVLA